jgi:putative photosynthetic complex assembly protein
MATTPNPANGNARSFGFGFKPLWGFFLILSATLLFAVVARQTGIGVVTIADSPVVHSRDVLFSDGEQGSIAVHDAKTGALIARYAAGDGAFIRGVMRGRARERRALGLGPEEPFRLKVHQDGRLTLEDAAADVRINLNSFGPTNLEAFARLLKP